MRRRQQRNNTFKRGYALTLAFFAAALIGYAIGGGDTVALRSDGPSAADTVALRFPSEWNKALPAANLVAAIKKPIVTAAANVTRDAQRVLFDPKPMDLPARVRQTVAQTAQVPASTKTPVSVQVAAASPSVTPDVTMPTPTAQPQPPPRPVSAMKTAERRRVVNRPGYMFDDAQIASIKERLNLTPDQEGMWPAVEAALRNMTYTHAKASQGAQSAPPSDDAQVAAVDPDSVANLKYAATPLIMSFSDDQKQQVRDIAHVMGLDQLASQF